MDGFSYPDWWQMTFPAGRQYASILDAQGRPVRLAYGEIGPGPRELNRMGRRALVLLHGIGSWSYNWRYVLPKLSEHYRVICLDAKGYGFSDKPEGPEVAGHQIVELGRFIEAVVGEPVWVMGESLGALTALGLAQRQPQWVERLVVINAPVFPKQLPSWGMQVLGSLPLEWVRWVDQQGWVEGCAPWVRQISAISSRAIVSDPSRVSAGGEAAYWATYPYVYRRGAIAQFAEDLRLGLREIEAHLRGESSLITEIQAQLPQTQTPTLVLWGDRDVWFPVEDGIALQAQLPQAQLRILPNCNHLASGDQPGLIAQAVHEFLAPTLASFISREGNPGFPDKPSVEIGRPTPYLDCQEST